VLKRVGRFYRTARHLRVSQLFGRARLHVWRPAAQLAAAPARRAQRVPLVPGAAHAASMLAGDEFSFMCERHRIRGPGDWDNPRWPRLWLYNLHYFDDLHAAQAPARAAWHGALIARWIAENPPGRRVGWEPYPTSRRILSWVKFALRGGTLTPAALHSLAVQVRWLRQRLEWHLGGNHLLANALALLCAGAFFEGPEADAWLAQGRRLVARELAAQILPDGGHYERSPMYHALVLQRCHPRCRGQPRGTAGVRRARARYGAGGACGSVAAAAGQRLCASAVPGGGVARRLRSPGSRAPARTWAFGHAEL
jgi:uncharacterized heparinase superfamily protein